MWHIHTMEYYSTIKKKELLHFLIAWMDLESIMLSGISYSGKDKYHMNSPVCET